MKDDKLRSYLKGRLGDYSLPVDDALRLSVIGNAALKKRRKIYPLVIYCASAAVLVFAVVMFTWQKGKDIEHVEQISHVSNVTRQSANRDSSNSEQLTEIHASETPADPIAIKPRKASSIIQDTTVEVSTEPEVVTDIPVDSVVVKEEPPKEKAEENIPPSSGNTDRGRAYPTPGHIPKWKQARRAKSTSLLLAVNGISSSGNNDGYGDMMGGNDPGDGAGITDPGDDPVEDAIYDYPLSFALTVRKDLFKRFSVETGLNYTYLHTMFQVPVGDAGIKLHYLGIPLKANYTFLDSRRISLYASAGGMIEKQVAGKFYSPKENRNLDNSVWQWSLNTSVGLNLKLGRRIGLFAEPGVSYFFDNGSNIPTIRHDKPLTFNLQVGLRFTFD